MNVMEYKMEKKNNRVGFWLTGEAIAKAGAAAAVLALVAFTAFFGGYFVSQGEFERDLADGWYLKNATKWEAAETRLDAVRAKGGNPWVSSGPPRAWAPSGVER